jgi:uncharacterized protein YecT (DUF1311 family)
MTTGYMNMKKTVFAIAMFLALPLALSAAASAQNKKDPCDNPQTQIEMDECQGREYKKADAALNAAYKQLMTKLDDEGERTVFKTAQQAWIKFRDAECEAESFQNKGGTIYPMVYSGCLTTLTQERTKQIKELIENH